MIEKLIDEHIEAHKNSELSQNVDYSKFKDLLIHLFKTDYKNIVKDFINKDNIEPLKKAVQFQSCMDYIILISGGYKNILSPQITFYTNVNQDKRLD